MPVRAETTASAIALFAGGCWVGRRFGFHATQPMRRLATATTIASCATLNIACEGNVGRHERTCVLFTTALFGGFCIASGIQPTRVETFKRGFLPFTAGVVTTLFGMKAQSRRIDLHKVVNESIRSLFDVRALFNGTYQLGNVSCRRRLFNCLILERMEPLLPSAIEGRDLDEIVQVIRNTTDWQLPLCLLRTWGPEAQEAVERYLTGGATQEEVDEFEREVRGLALPEGVAQEDAFRTAVQRLNEEHTRLRGLMDPDNRPSRMRCRGHWGFPPAELNLATPIPVDVLTRLEELNERLRIIELDLPTIADFERRVRELEQPPAGEAAEEIGFCLSVRKLCRAYALLMRTRRPGRRDFFGALIQGEDVTRLRELARQTYVLNDKRSFEEMAIPEDQKRWEDVFDATQEVVMDAAHWNDIYLALGIFTDDNDFDRIAQELYVELAMHGICHPHDLMNRNTPGYMNLDILASRGARSREEVRDRLLAHITANETD